MAKFSALVAFARRLPELRRVVEADMQCAPLSRARVLATLVRLLDRTLIRIGNDVYAAENNSYGLTTLRARQLDLNGTRLRLRFRGKSGQEWALHVTDRRVASTVRRLPELPGQRLFRYLDEDGQPCDVHSHDVNACMRAAMGDDFTSKHFRIWGATLQAAVALEQSNVPDTQRQQARTLDQVLDRIAANLRHTRMVCRNCYVHPTVIDEWREGRLARQMGAIRAHLDTPREGLDGDEEVVLRWLERRARGGRTAAAA